VLVVLQRCCAPGCPAIQAEPYCPEHARPAWREGGRSWRKLSEAYRAEHPVCEDCDGDEPCERPSAIVHHLDGRGPTGPRGHDPDNLMALCRAHHAKRTEPWRYAYDEELRLSLYAPSPPPPAGPQPGGLIFS
jgi:5-methylcytosine-specific restriction enzyme A